MVPKAQLCIPVHCSQQQLNDMAGQYLAANTNEQQLLHVQSFNSGQCIQIGRQCWLDTFGLEDVLLTPGHYLHRRCCCLTRTLQALVRKNSSASLRFDKMTKAAEWYFVHGYMWYVNTSCACRQQVKWSAQAPSAN